MLAHRADHGAGLVYELVYDGGGKDGKRHLPGLLDVEKLRAAHDYDASRPGSGPDHPGQNEGHPAPVRPPSGPVPGSVRGGKNAAPASENPVSEKPIRPKTRIWSPGPAAA